MSTEQIAAGLANCGSILALVVSFTVNKSIGWGIVHALCGWFYVIYYGLFC